MKNIFRVLLALSFAVMAYFIVLFIEREPYISYETFELYDDAKLLSAFDRVVMGHDGDDGDNYRSGVRKFKLRSRDGKYSSLLVPVSQIDKTIERFRSVGIPVIAREG